MYYISVNQLLHEIITFFPQSVWKLYRCTVNILSLSLRKLQKELFKPIS